MSSIQICPLCKNEEFIKENKGFFVYGEEGGFWQLLYSICKFWAVMAIIYWFLDLLGITITIYSESQGNIFNIG